MPDKPRKITKQEREEIKQHPWLHKSPEYVPPKAQPRYYDWDPEVYCIDAPLIGPEMIPFGYEQHWDSVEKKYVLVRRQKPVGWNIQRIQNEDFIQFKISDTLYYVIDLKDRGKKPPVQEAA
jgi:hypothetical protein